MRHIKLRDRVMQLAKENAKLISENQQARADLDYLAIMSGADELLEVEDVRED